MNHGLDCDCKECRAIRRFIRLETLSGRIYLSGTEADKKKILS